MSRKRTKTRRPAAVHSDTGTPEREQHDRYVTDKVATEDTTQRDRRRYLLNDPLHHYKRTRVITARQRDAGFELRELWHGIGLEGRTITNYDEYIAAGSVASLRIVSIDNYRDFRHAVAAIRLPSQQRAVIQVCCFEEALRYGQGRHLEAGLERLRWHFRL